LFRLFGYVPNVPFRDAPDLQSNTD